MNGEWCDVVLMESAVKKWDWINMTIGKSNGPAGI